MTPTQLHPTDLIAVPVPGNEKLSSLEILKGPIKYWLETESKRICISKDEVRILGTCTKSGIDFDVLPHISSLSFTESQIGYKDYEGNYLGHSKPDSSFRSLLTANGLHFENNDNIVEKLVILKRV